MSNIRGSLIGIEAARPMRVPRLGALAGPSLIVAYSHCIAHGIDMQHGMKQQDLAVASGYWPLQAMAAANGWIEVPAGSEGYAAGSEVMVRPWP